MLIYWEVYTLIYLREVLMLTEKFLHWIKEKYLRLFTCENHLHSNNSEVLAYVYWWEVFTLIYREVPTFIYLEVLTFIYREVLTFIYWEALTFIYIQYNRSWDNIVCDVQVVRISVDSDWDVHFTHEYLLLINSPVYL